MPIEKVEGGYRWGSHGKVYPTREGAEKQAAAAHANGWTGDKMNIKGAGICLIDPNGEALFIKRSPDANHPNQWDFPGGRADENETPQDTAKRETREEIGMLPSGKLEGPIETEGDDDSGNKVDFVTFTMRITKKFDPQLDKSEHTEFKWSKLGSPPEPLHPGVRETVKKLLGSKMAGDKNIFALDKGSVRRYDIDGRLHVAIANISKANVCPYLGSEIPDAEELGLDPGKIYHLYRDPEELEKAAPTANGIQLLSTHVEVSASEPQKKVIAGTTGTDAVFNVPYLQNSLIVWDADDIKNIEENKVKELSCGYRYRLDLTAGSIDGVRYDGVMRDIVFNHVALVPEGRAGSDVVVGDSINPNILENQMSKKALSAKAAMVKGAVLAHFGNKLAADAMPKLNVILKDVRQATWDKQKTGVIAQIAKLTKDATPEELSKVLEKMDGVKDEDDDDDDLENDMNGNKPDMVPDSAGSEVAELLKRIKECVEKLEGAKANDEPPQTANAANANPKDDENKEPVVEKKAMDAAIKDAENRTIARMNAIYSAEKDVKPYVGKIKTAMDSAQAIYKFALDSLKIDVKDVPPSAGAYRAILLAQPKPGEEIRHSSIAKDSSTSLPENIAAIFPDMYRAI